MKKLIMSIIAVVMGGFMMVAPLMAGTPAFAEDDCTSRTSRAAILKDTACSENGGGSSIIGILTLVIDIMTVLIGILAVIGVTIVGIQYLTAGGSEEKTRKAKRRMFEIVIGIVAYVLMYAFLKWLLPSFS